MSSFDPEKQIGSVDRKLVASLHKVGEVFKSLLLQTGKMHGLSPIQIQILLFVAYHQKPGLSTVSHLSQELNLTKPTVSDAVRVLFQKGLIEKLTNEDTRSYSIFLTENGRGLLPKLEEVDKVVLQALSLLPDAAKAELLGSMLTILDTLEDKGIIRGQRMCLRCQYLHRKPTEYYCQLLEKKLLKQDLRVDCPEFLSVES